MPDPTFAIIGAMKGGTSSLHRYLGAHPDVSVSTPKETDFFLGRDSKTMDWYLSLFDEEATARGEASPNYTKRHAWPGVAERMAAAFPGLRLICVLRDPIDRAVSHYVHNYAHGRESDPFAKATIGPDTNYVRTSEYAFQLKSFFDCFSEERILILKSENMRSARGDVLKKTFRFLGVDPTFEVPIIDREFHASSEKKRVSFLKRHFGHRPRLRRVLRRVFPARFSEPQPFERPQPSAEDVRRLADLLRPDAERLRALVGKPFRGWSV